MFGFDKLATGGFSCAFTLRQQQASSALAAIIIFWVCFIYASVSKFRFLAKELL